MIKKDKLDDDEFSVFVLNEVIAEGMCNDERKKELRVIFNPGWHQYEVKIENIDKEFRTAFLRAAIDFYNKV